MEGVTGLTPPPGVIQKVCWLFTLLGDPSILSFYPAKYAQSICDKVAKIIATRDQSFFEWEGRNAPNLLLVWALPHTPLGSLHRSLDP